MKYFLFITYMAILFLSCETRVCPESQSNEILTEYVAQTDIYQRELYRLMEESEFDVRYFFKERKELRGANHLVLEVFGNDFCGDWLLQVRTEDEQSQKLQDKSGYSGAELVGLYFIMDGATPVFSKLEGIID